MHISPVFIVGLLLANAEGVLGGSRFWEAKAPNKRMKSMPEYQPLETFNSTSPLIKRAMSIKSLPSDVGANRIWPNKKIKYCFVADPTAAFRGQWESAMRAWAALDRHGFTYEEVSREICTSQPSSHLRIFYNNNGRLTSTVGIPVIDDAANQADPDNAVIGPFTHLSDLATVGQEDVVANMAHELGHIWGLHHGHQIPDHWEVSDEDIFDSWNINGGKEALFATSKFNCENLKDHHTVKEKVQKSVDAAVGAERDGLEDEHTRLCISRDVAQKYGFSASEWLPMVNTARMVIDEDFDRDSIMLYPSRAGGKESGGVRAIVMTYKDGSEIPNRVTPSIMDVERLVALYGDPAPSTLQVPHVGKGSKFLNKFKELRKKASFRRYGDTKDGICPS
ncbi:unnamed protein product [Alternaria alternata]